jgi:hypothetical protein
MPRGTDTQLNKRGRAVRRCCRPPARFANPVNCRAAMRRLNPGNSEIGSSPGRSFAIELHGAHVSPCAANVPGHIERGEKLGLIILLPYYLITLLPYYLWV